MDGMAESRLEKYNLSLIHHNHYPLLINALSICQHYGKTCG